MKKLPCALFCFYVFLLAFNANAQKPAPKKYQASLKSAEKYIDDNTASHQKEFFELVSLPSISSIPSHKPDVEKAAAWIVAKLKSIGFANAEAMSTPGSPVVFGSWEGAKGKPTVLIYAHYDVQPVKEEEWKYPPFTPTLEDGKIYGRGSSDDKGGVMISIWGVEALMKTSGKLPMNVKFIFDGEEEVGSPNLGKFISEHKELLKADYALNADGLQFSDKVPSVWMGLRGAAQLEFHIKTANYDAHSGLFGGKTPNSAKALAEIISSFYNADGSVAVEGFYNNVLPITPEEKAIIAKIPYNPADDMKELGTTAEVGDPAYAPLERIWYRPTLEIVGMQGGYTAAEGFSNIIPGHAMGRITCRTVNNQSAKEVVQSVINHINKHLPPGATVTYKAPPGLDGAMKFPSNTKAYQNVASVLTDVYGTPPLQTAVGGSIGTLLEIKNYLGLYAYSFGVQLADEKFHASNEFTRVASLRKGQVMYVNYLLYVGGQ